jgi:hypothetical protein
MEELFAARQEVARTREMIKRLESDLEYSEKTMYVPSSFSGTHFEYRRNIFNQRFCLVIGLAAKEERAMKLQFQLISYRLYKTAQGKVRQLEVFGVVRALLRKDC